MHRPPLHRQIGLITANAPRSSLRINRPQAHIAKPSRPPPAAPGVFQHAHPSAQYTTPWRFARKTTPVPDPTSQPPLPKLFSSASPTVSSPAPPGTTRGRSPPSRGTHTCARGPPLFSSEGRGRCSTPAPWCPPRTPPAATASGYFYLHVLLSSAFFFIFLQSCRAAFFPVLHLAFGPAVACRSGRISCPKSAKVGGAGGALREEHLLW